MDITSETKIMLENMIRINMNGDRGVNLIKDKCGMDQLEAVYHYRLFKVKFMEREMQANIPEPDYKFGDWVTFKDVLRRSSVTDNRLRQVGEVKDFTLKDPYVYWKPVPAYVDKRAGIFLGYRRLQNGYYVYENAEEGGGRIDVRRSTYIKSALICRSGRNKPERVAVQGMHKMEKQ